MKVVEDDINNQQEFLEEFDARCEARLFPIVIKIDEGPDLTRLMLGGSPLVEFIRTHQHTEHIMVEIDNLVQEVPGVQTRKWFNELPFFHFKGLETNPKQLKRKFMLFVGNHRWPRFLLAQYLYTNYKDQSYLTYWHTRFPVGNLTQHLDQESINQFIKRLPLYIDSDEIIERHANGFINFVDTNPLQKFYHKAFIDIVCETWHMGETFMPTEKIARPLAMKNPFLVYGPKHFLRNLRRLGFKTFNDYWSEDYDNYQGLQRIDLIKSQMDRLSGLSMSQLQSMLAEMENVLEHNRTLYQNIKLDHINKEFSCRLT